MRKTSERYGDGLTMMDGETGEGRREGWWMDGWTAWLQTAQAISDQGDSARFCRARRRRSLVRSMDSRCSSLFLSWGRKKEAVEEEAVVGGWWLVVGWCNVLMGPLRDRRPSSLHLSPRNVRPSQRTPTALRDNHDDGGRRQPARPRAARRTRPLTTHSSSERYA